MKLPLIVIAIIINDVYSSFLNSYVRQVCGGEKKCVASGNSTLPRDSCCRPCECDRICLEKRTCCEDSGFRLDATKDVTMQKCLPSAKSAKVMDYERHSNKYYVRATCPDKYANKQVRYKCESNESDDIEDIPFVSSNDGKIIYKNRHCAVCHGEEKFISWNLEVDMFCIKRIFSGTDGKVVSTNHTFINKALVNFCTISFERPAITDIRYTICHEEQNLISTCEEMTLPLDNITIEMEELCLNDSAALTFFQNFMLGKGYNNVYCYLCNNNHAVVTCDLEHIEKSTKSLIFLLNSGPLIEIGKEDGKGLCGHAEVFDTFFGKCRRIFCPTFEFPRGGVCTSLVLSRRINYAFNFKVFQISKKYWKPGEFNYFLQIFHMSLLKNLGLRRCSVCGFWYKEGRLNSTKTFYLRVAIATTEECDFDLVLSLAASLEKKVRSNQNLTYVIKNVEILIRYIWSDEEYMNLTAYADTLLSRNIVSCRTFSPARFHNCQKITLTADEYKFFANQSEIEEYETAQNQQGAFELCYADYKELVNKMTSKVQEKSLSHTLAIASVVLILIFI